LPLLSVVAFFVPALLAIAMPTLAIGAPVFAFVTMPFTVTVDGVGCATRMCVTPLIP
jgi:hypothetical protein